MQAGAKTCITTTPCKLDNCVQCSSNTTCSLCTGLANFLDTSKGTCTGVTTAKVPFCTAFDKDAKCTGCMSGFTLDTTLGFCFATCIANCATCADNQFCLVCTPPYNLINGACVKPVPCPLGYYGTGCTSTCSSITSALTCTNNCPNWYWDGTAKTCSSCLLKYGAGCTSCDSTGCIKCGVTTLTNKAAKCPSGGLCPAINNCVLCNDATACIACNGIGNILSADSKSCTDQAAYTIPYCAAYDTTTPAKCTKCILNYALSYPSANGVCAPTCIANCVTCSDHLYCINCADGYNNVNGACVKVTTCPYGYFGAGCTTSCLTITDATCSTNCPGWYLNEANLCRPCTKFGAGCTSCDTKGCFICGNTKMTTQAANCAVGNTCNIANCATCNGTLCNVCTGLNNILSSDQKSCAAASCSVAFCSNCSGANCAACMPGFTFMPPTVVIPNGFCAPTCISNCVTCTDTLYCINCADGYSLVNSTCVKITITPSATSPSLCSFGTFGASCSSQCTSIADSSNCTTNCPGWYWDTSCTPCTIKYGAGCTTCDSKGCSVCGNTKMVNPVQNCAPAEPCNIANCVVCTDATTCAICTGVGNILSADKKTCTDQAAYKIASCSGYDASNKCTGCYAGFTLMTPSPTVPNGFCTANCIANCVTCTDNLFCINCATNYSNVNGACVLSNTTTIITTVTLPCPLGYYGSGCSNFCPFASDATTCTSNCPGWFWDTSCQPCLSKFGAGCTTCDKSGCSTCGNIKLTAPVQTCAPAAPCNIANCVLCSNSSTCSVCTGISNILSADFKTCATATCSVAYCTTCSGVNCTACLTGYTLIPASYTVPNGFCTPNCVTNCVTCTDNLYCLKCAVNYNNVNGVCVSSPSCIINNCATCLNGIYCATCKTGFSSVLGGLACVANCQDSNCLVCINTATCTTCKPGFKVVNNVCVADICSIFMCNTCASALTCGSCGSLFALSSDSTKCSSNCAVTNCAFCSNSTTCSVCNAGFTLSSTNTCNAICSITNCATCLSSTTCLTCQTGYLLSTTNDQCVLSCGDSYCRICNSTTVCSTCRTGFSVNAFGKCAPSCRNGFSLLNNTCTYCNGLLGNSNCESCAVNPAGTNYICTVCAGGFYLTTGVCLACSASMINCRSCSISTYCDVCASGYYSMNGVCVTINCAAGVKNCLNCTVSQGTFCQTCMNGFIPDPNGRCIVVFNNGSSNAISCTVGSYAANGVCTACSDVNCLNCTASVCYQCFPRYFKSAANTCSPCIANCVDCADATTCNLCQPPYTYNYGTNPSCILLMGSGGRFVTTDSTAYYTCDVGCVSCTAGISNTLVCNVVAPGYSLSLGRIFKCADNCMSCLNSASICTDCYPGFGLSGSSCVKCTDGNGLGCSAGDSSYTAACNTGYTLSVNISISPATSTCLACAANCYRCDLNGAGNCDANYCFPGFVQVTGTKICTKCFNGCPVCSASDPLKCISCGDRRYNDTTSNTCLACPAGCLSCTSATVCTSCAIGYTLTGGACNVASVWPCVLTNGTSCIKCAYQFTLSTNNTCSFDNTCNGTKTCPGCPNGQYITLNNNNQVGTCSACPNLPANCVACDPLNPANCIACGSGYYVVYSNNSCAACPTGCAQCSSANFCYQTLPGYFSPLAQGRLTGQVLACAWPCLTCDSNANLCLSCVADHYISGASCFSSKQLTYSATIASNNFFKANDSFATAYSNILNNFNSMRGTICKNLPFNFTLADPTCSYILNVASIRTGSVVLDLLISTAGYNNIGDAITALNTANLMPDAVVVSSGVVASSSNYYPDSTVGNTGLIAGLVVPLGVIRILFSI